MISDYKTIAVHVNESQHCLSRLRLAANLAEKFDAHLIGIAATGLPASFYVPVLAGDGTVVVPELIDTMQERADASLALFDSVADKANVRSFEKRTFATDPGIALSLQARYADLLIVGQDDPGDATTIQSPVIAEYVFLNSVSPVLIVPYRREFSDVGGRVLVAWNGSIEATRAIRGAVPFLKNAEIVDIATFDAKAESEVNGEASQADIALFLARHGVKVNVSHEARARNMNTADALLARLKEVDADLLVMGGYGRARFLEVVLGGTTRNILKSMTVPVLIAH